MASHSFTRTVRKWASSALLATSFAVGATALSSSPAIANFTPPPPPEPCELGLPNSTGPITIDAAFGSNGTRAVPQATIGLFAGSNSSFITNSAEIVPGDMSNTLSRYLPNGTLDETWGTAGQLRIDIKPSVSPDPDNINESPQRASVTFPDGSLILYIPTSRYRMGQGETDVSRNLVKVTASGSLDNSFGTSGIKDVTSVTTNSKNLYIDAMTRGVAGPSGTFLFQARLYDNNFENREDGVVKFDAAGDLVQSFGQNGFVAVPFPAGDLANFAGMNTTTFDTDVDGNIYVGTTTSNTQDSVVYKFSASGAAVQSFGTNGVLTLNTSSEPVEFVSKLDFNDGKLLASIASGTADVSTQNSYTRGVRTVKTIVRVSTSGVLDASFGVDGRATISPAASHTGLMLSNFSPLPDGGMLLVSPGDMMSQSPTTFAQLSPNGTSMTSWFSVKLGTCNNTNYPQDPLVTSSGVFLLAINSNNIYGPEFLQVTNMIKFVFDGMSVEPAPVTPPAEPVTQPAPTEPATPVTPAATPAAATPAAVTATTTTVPVTSTTVATASTTLPAPALSVVRALPTASKPIVTDTAITTGEKISVTFSGFKPFEFVQLIVASTPRVIGSGTANAQGVVTLEGNLPANLSSGTHTLAVFAPVSGIGFTQKITVVPSTLPATGSDNQPSLLVLALMLFCAGLLARRTTKVTSQR
jgi:LPXTG-motif cell wall-anchored protein